MCVGKGEREVVCDELVGERALIIPDTLVFKGAVGTLEESNKNIFDSGTPEDTAIGTLVELMTCDVTM